MRQWIILLAVCNCAFLGCSSNERATYPVEGKVSFADGRPLAGGTVEFQYAGEVREGESKVSARGTIEKDGTFVVSTFVPGDGAIAGRHRALVVPAMPPGPINQYNPSPPVIHDRFLRFDTSGLEFTVEPDSPNKFEITVTPPK